MKNDTTKFFRKFASQVTFPMSRSKEIVSMNISPNMVCPIAHTLTAHARKLSFLVF